MVLSILYNIVCDSSDYLDTMQNSALDHDRAAALQCVWDDDVHGLAALLDRGVKLDPTARSPRSCTVARTTLSSGKSLECEAVFRRPSAALPRSSFENALYLCPYATNYGA